MGRTCPALALGALALLAGCGRERRPPQGVIVVVIDTLRADFVGLYGSEWPATPSIDAIGREGVLFERAYSQASWTRPSVPTMFTCLYPSEHHLTDFISGRGSRATRGARLSGRAETLAEVFSAGGYRTALAGFQAQLSPRFNLGQGFDQYNNNLKGGGGEIVRTFIDWLDREPRKPFFAYLHFLDIHWPYCPPGGFYRRFDPTETRMDVCGNGKALQAALEDRSLVPTDAERRALRARYAEALLALDGHLGALFKELRERGRFDDSLIVVTSDHGQEFGEHGGYTHGATLYDEMLHVPFLWKLPKSWGAGGGRRVAPMVETRSLLPTLAEAAGLAKPAAATAPSLLPWLLGVDGGLAPVRFVAAESNGLFAVRDERYKLVVVPERGTFALFDELADPRELTDVAAKEPEALERMRETFRAWWAHLAPLPLGDSPDAALDAETESALKSLGYLN